MILDISQELFSCRVFPGDPAPKRERISSMEDGAAYNLTALSLCAHNGTHADAPFHFLREGKTIGELDPAIFLGHAFVYTCAGELTGERAEALLGLAARCGADQRLLLRGDCVVTAEAARVFAASPLRLLGVESQTVGPEEAPMEVHLILLGAEKVLLEGLRLGRVPDGRYFLSALPLNLGEADGAPCRAVLMTEN